MGEDRKEFQDYLYRALWGFDLYSVDKGTLIHSENVLSTSYNPCAMLGTGEGATLTQARPLLSRGHQSTWQTDLEGHPGKEKCRAPPVQSKEG